MSHLDDNSIFIDPHKYDAIPFKKTKFARPTERSERYQTLPSV